VRGSSILPLGKPLSTLPPPPPHVSPSIFPPGAAASLDDAPPPSAHHARLGDLLVERGLIARRTVDELAGEAHAAHQKSGELMVRKGLVDEADLYRALSAQWNIPFLPLETLVQILDADVSEAVPRIYLERNAIIPIARSETQVVVATTEPTANADDVMKALGVRSAAIYLVTPTDYRRIWMLVDMRKGRQIGDVSGLALNAGVGDLLDRDRGHEAHCIGLFEALLLEAIAERASDIHLERYVDEVRARLRIDGDLHDVSRIKLSTEDLIGVVNVVKVGANLDIAERRLPQGGRIRRKAGGKIFDLRVQTQPALYGEHVIIRLLPQDTKVATVEDLGFAHEPAQEYRRLLDSPGGLVLVVGPTGSGKSTTLYAGLQHISRDATRKVITAEDPIEYAVSGVQQTQVRPELGFAFAQAMRAFVREDPDVILVGEIRDGETALEAIRASQTGHLVLSTLHCNDAVDAVQRLMDLGMHANSVASELLSVIAQRLAKRICEGCREEVAPDPAIFAELFPGGADEAPPGFRAFRGRGCARCGNRGTHGRIAVIEQLKTSPVVRRAICRKVSVDDLRVVALDAGLVTMRESALDLVTRGVIPMSELPWILPAERMASERRGGNAATFGDSTL
jgi:type IV pilus assembly protein PilB